MRRVGTFVLVASYCIMFFVLIASPASAEIEGPCTASFNGIPFDDLDTPSEARDRLVIQPGGSVILRATVPDTDFVYVDVLFPPFTITLAEFEADEPSDQGSDLSEVEGEIALGDLASYGAGIFQFVGRTDDCWGNAYFIIGGIKPWETAVGKTAIGIAGIGVLIGLTSWIPALVSGGGGIIKSVMAGGPIGIGGAIVAQQAGRVPLSATSVGVAVVGSSVVSIFVTKGLGSISGAFTGGGAASGAGLPTPPLTSPPPAAVGTPAGSSAPPAKTPMPPAQDAPAPPGREKIFVDDARLLGGETTPVPDATLTRELPEVPVQEAILTDGALPPTETPLTPAQSTPPPAAPSPPAAPITPGSTAPPAGTAASPSPPGIASPQPGGTAPPLTPGGSAAVGGSGMGLAAGSAAAAGVAGAASQAAAAQERATSGGQISHPYRFYVSATTDLYGIADYGTVIARLVPGTGYTAKATYDDWVHVFDESSGLEGWVVKDAVTRHEA